MSKLFLCAHTAKLTSRRIIDQFEADGLINDWFFSMNGTFFFRSDKTTKELGERLIAHFGKVRFLIVDITDTSKWGALPPGHWERINSSKKRDAQ
jgi:hypothetical protein